MTERQTGTRGWWLWIIGGAVVCIGVVLLLEPWFRVTTSPAIGWGVFAGTTFRNRRGIDLRQRPLWWLSAAMVLLLVGLALVLGAVGLSNDDDRTDSVVPGAVLGGVMLVLGAVGLLLVRFLQRRRAVDAEVERFRDEQSASTTADDPA
jgi:drug/metabolite transporter (DMT)-like permease